MTAKCTFKCDFCNKELSNYSINEDHMGVCKSSFLNINTNTHIMWTNNLTDCLQGPHICYSCAKEIIKQKENMKAFKIKKENYLGGKE